jgi:hypothetical protein
MATVDRPKANTMASSERDFFIKVSDRKGIKRIAG